MTRSAAAAAPAPSDRRGQKADREEANVFVSHFGMVRTKSGVYVHPMSRVVRRWIAENYD